MQNYHKHSCWSNIRTQDSTISYEDYAKRVKELGHKVLSSVEHGWQGYYYQVFELAEKYDLKFVFGTECYWVKDRHSNDKANCHMVILAKNENGRRAINNVLSEANLSGYYYKPRLDIELLLSLPSEDVFVTTACIAFWKYEDIEDIFIKLKKHFKDNIMLEIQYHDTPQQVELNKRIKDLANKTDTEMIVGLDSHYIYENQFQERKDYLEANRIFYEDEVGWYMDYPDDETVIKRFLKQGVFTKEEIQKAMDNTDICLTFEDISFDKSIKLPNPFPNKTVEERRYMYTKLIADKLRDYLKNVPKEKRQEYVTGVLNEVNTYKETNMTDYPLLDYMIVQRALQKGGLITYSGRGSGASYFTNSLCGFSKVDRFVSPIKLYPERFISKSRILVTNSLPDLDLNVSNPEIFAEAQAEIMGENHSYPMIAFGTLKIKSAFKMYSRAMKLEPTIANEVSKQIDKYEKAYAFAEDDEKDTIDIYDYVDAEYHSYIRNSQKYRGIITDKKQAPCSYLLYQGDIKSEIGLIKCKSDTTGKESITTVIDGAIAEKYKFLKNDLLKVDVVLLINKIYNRIGIKQHTVVELSKLVENNQKVWDIYAKGCTLGINQCESPATTKKAMKYKPKNISELSAFIAAIRPAFKSMYTKFESREDFSYGIDAFDKILQTPQFPQSFILYQEQTMNTLNYAGFPIGECYGIIKDIAKKHPEKVKPLKERFIEGFKKRIIEDDNVSEDKAIQYSNQVWQIISDSCGYGFNSSHAYCMALDSLWCAYLKSHYPVEFYETLLQHYSEKGNKNKVALLKNEMKQFFSIQEGEYVFGVDNRRFVAVANKNEISPSLLSLRDIGQSVADELYRISSEGVTDFYDLLVKMTDSKGIKSNHIKILAGIGYFKQFGNNKKIFNCINAFNKLYKKSQFKKNNMPDMYSDLIINNSSETEKMYTKFNYEKALREYFENVPDTADIKSLIKYQLEYIGYILYSNPNVSDSLYCVVDMKDYNNSNKPYTNLYQIKTGCIIKGRVNSRMNFVENPFKISDIISCSMQNEKMIDWRVF